MSALFVPARLAGQDSPATVAASALPAPSTVNPSTSSVLANFVNQHGSDYEPIYFILGTYPAAKFQLSLKYQFFSLPDEDFLSHIYFGYTQTSFWDLLTSDPSFFDTSYKPSLFVLQRHILKNTIEDPVRLSVQVGAEHESNGRGGTLERSQYTAYVQTPITFGVPNELQLTLLPRFWYYLDLGHNNKDLAQYRGYGDLITRLTWQKKDWAYPIQLEAKLQAGTGFRHPGEQLDFRFNLPYRFHFSPAIQVEYFNGYGQNLIQYNVSSQAIRVGFCLFYPGLIKGSP